MAQGSFRWRALISCFFVLGVVPGLGSRTAEGHGFMTKPRSRAADHLRGDIRGWPIAGVSPHLTRRPCLELPATNQLTEVQPGPLRLNFIFGDGANHVGPCEAFLLDPAHPEQKLKIGEMMNCARSDHPGPGHKGEDVTGHMTAAIPSTVPCDPAHCVLKWEWTATHISVTKPEYYDDCADLRITGAHEAAAIAESPMGSQGQAREATDASLSAALKPSFSATEETAARHPAYPEALCGL